MPTNDPTADAPELVKLPNSREAELSYTCPWCLQRTSCSLLSAAEFSLGQAWEVFALAKCGHARCKKMALVRFVTQTYWLQTQSPIPTPKTEVKVISIYPPPLRKYAPVGVPTEVAADMTEALGCFAHEYWVASAVVGRRALERGVEHKLAELPEVKPRSRDLVDQIDALPDSVLPLQWRQAAHQVRLIGNEGAHPEVVTQEDAHSLLEFVEGVFNQMFTMQEKLKAAIAARPIPPPRPLKKSGA